ncbi:MAG: RNA 2',3'-cyclic phosphodiesterase [Planctomycetota bacterium]
MKDRLRTFVAVELSKETRSSLGAEIGRLRELGANVKWVSPEDLHITVKFLGQVDRRDVPGILGALEKAARARERFAMEISGLSFFPRPTKPRVVAAGVDEGGAASLTLLAASVEDALVEVGFGREGRGFKAHVTLGRVKSPKGIAALSDYLLTHDGRPFGEEQVESVALVMSELRREGPVYTVLGHASLAG